MLSVLSGDAWMQKTLNAFCLLPLTVLRAWEVLLLCERWPFSQPGICLDTYHFGLPFGPILSALLTLPGIGYTFNFESSASFA